MDLPAGGDEMPAKLRQLTGSGRCAEELGRLHEDDGATDAADKTAHDGCGDKIEYLSRAQRREQQQPQRRIKRQHRNEREGLFRAERNAERGENCPDHGRRGGVHTEDKLRRGGKEREQQHWQHRAVQPIHRGQTRNLRVAHRDRDGHSGDDHAGEQILWQILFFVPLQGRENRQLHGAHRSFTVRRRTSGRA